MLRPGFTPLEFVLVAALVFASAIVFVKALNPPRSIALTNNAQRWSNVETILQGAHQYALSHAGKLPAQVGAEPIEICRPQAQCGGMADFSALVGKDKILSELPNDPIGATQGGTGYYIHREKNGRLTVSAPNAELGVAIEVSW